MANPYYNGIGASVRVFDPSNQMIMEMDTVTFEYNESQNKLPIYGYKSFLYDDVLYGEIMVSGTFMLNKDESVTLHRYVGNQPHPETDNLPINMRASRFLTQSKLVFQIIHNTEVLEANPTYTNNKYEIAFTLEDVEVTGMRHSIGASGDPVGEFYDFIGKRVTDTPALLRED